MMSVSWCLLVKRCDGIKKKKHTVKNVSSKLCVLLAETDRLALMNQNISFRVIPTLTGPCV